MKIIKTEYSKLSECQGFMAWFWFTRDYPAGYQNLDWFKYCGNSNRVLIRRRFGWSIDVAYNRKEIGILYVFLHLIRVILFLFLLMEIAVIFLY